MGLIEDWHRRWLRGLPPDGDGDEVAVGQFAAGDGWRGWLAVRTVAEGVGPCAER